MSRCRGPAGYRVPACRHVMARYRGPARYRSAHRGPARHHGPAGPHGPLRTAARAGRRRPRLPRALSSPASASAGRPSSGPRREPWRPPRRGPTAWSGMGARGPGDSGSEPGSARLRPGPATPGAAGGPGGLPRPFRSGARPGRGRDRHPALLFRQAMQSRACRAARPSEGHAWHQVVPGCRCQARPAPRAAGPATAVARTWHRRAGRTWSPDRDRPWDLRPGPGPGPGRRLARHRDPARSGRRTAGRNPDRRDEGAACPRSPRGPAGQEGRRAGRRVPNRCPVRPTGSDQIPGECQPRDRARRRMRGHRADRHQGSGAGLHPGPRADPHQEPGADHYPEHRAGLRQNPCADRDPEHGVGRHQEHRAARCQNPGADRRPGPRAGRHQEHSADLHQEPGADRYPEHRAGPCQNPGADRDPEHGAARCQNPGAGWGPGPRAGRHQEHPADLHQEPGADRYPEHRAGPCQNPGADRYLGPGAGLSQGADPRQGRLPGRNGPPHADPGADRGTGSAAGPGRRPGRAGPAGHACITAKARVTAVTWVSAEAWGTGARVRAGTEVTAPGRLVPSVGIGCPAIRGRILIGDGGGQAPARVPRGLRTAVAHAPSPVPGHLAGCRRDLLEVTPS